MFKLKPLSRSASPIVAALALLLTGLALAAGPCWRLGDRIYTKHLGEKQWIELSRNKRPLTADDPVARLIIREVDLAHNVVLGASKKHLDHSPAIDEESSTDNKLVILGHRDTHFNNLKHLKVGASVELLKLDHLTQYRVKDIEIHTPTSLKDRIDGLNAPDTLLLVSCYPFHYFGSAPKRFLAICEERHSQKKIGKEAGEKAPN